MATQPIVEPEVKNAQPEVDPETGKFVHIYQPRDAEGQFIGKPYRFLYTDHMDLVRQIEQAKEHADRYIYEVKTGKRQVNGEAAAPKPEFVPAPESTEEVDKKRREEFRKTMREEFGAEPEVVRETLKKSTKLEEGVTAYHWALNKQAEGYYPCADNSKKIVAWLTEKKYAFTPANYDLAFEELKDSLMKAPQEITADSTQQPPPTKAEVKPQSTGIIPGQFAGTRRPNPTDRQPLTRDRFREIDKMSRDQWKKLERTNPKDAQSFLAMKHAQPQQ